jgi:sulfur carrier protein
MSVIVNGEPVSLPAPETLEALLLRLSPSTPFAVACNGEFVPRHAYETVTINHGDAIEIVHPAAGG